jgi:NTE family protein
VNQPLREWDPNRGYRSQLHERPQASDQLVLLLAFSGGGTRASAYAYGALEELAVTHVAFDGRVRSLIDEVDQVSGVSGGSFTAAYLGIHGRDAFRDFPERFLERDVQSALLLRLLWPINWLKLFSPYWARSDLAADYYDKTVFDGARFRDLEGVDAPFVAIHATDLTTGSPFAFVQDVFDYLCSDVSEYPVSRAVASSSAVPLVLSPITLRNYPGCGFEAPEWVAEAQEESRELDLKYVTARSLGAYLAKKRRYVRLVDGVIGQPGRARAVRDVVGERGAGAAAAGQSRARGGARDRERADLFRRAVGQVRSAAVARGDTRRGDERAGQPLQPRDDRAAEADVPGVERAHGEVGPARALHADRDELRRRE